MRTDIDGLPFVNPHGLPIHDLRTFDDTATSRYAASAMTSLVDSPTSSTDARSISCRRADFAPSKPTRNWPTAHLAGRAPADGLSLHAILYALARG